MPVRRDSCGALLVEMASPVSVAFFCGMFATRLLAAFRLAVSGSDANACTAASCAGTVANTAGIGATTASISLVLAPVSFQRATQAVKRTSKALFASVTFLPNTKGRIRLQRHGFQFCSIRDADDAQRMPTQCANGSLSPVGV